ncbi:hypothetical protein E1N52_40635 [Paraburkholderia guartelaensis]|uniref:DUF2946 domain-containing protein n=1 Tax=Paraburkholderia guartelaensis TaxID=2546446 RepID=A0A4R5L1A0_9BURK|nr:hypothetical protein [Paraburkholderia guartelaensis]TDG02263.1 hypothetical protein E1N52_40635 [Paraburkholderia guartelaensis]
MLRKIWIYGVAVFLFALTGLKGSAAEHVPIQVSLVIQESCEIQSAAGTPSPDAPGVSCLHGALYHVALAPRDPTQRLSTLQLANLAAPRAVWAVAF